MKGSIRSSFRFSSATVRLGLVGLGLGLGFLTASAVIAQSWPDWSGEPLYGEVDLYSGFTPDPYLIDVDAGGDTDVGALGLGGDCTGFISAEQPDFRVNYDASEYNASSLSFMVESASDTTLVISGPDSSWYCSDDFNGSINPMVMFTYPESGQYDIWIGHFGDSSTHPAELYVTEYDLTGY
jgi:hypothetical protein